MIAPETPVGKLGERGRLRHLESRIPLGPGVVVGVGDDAAAVELGPLPLVTTDSLVENVHFRREWTPPRLLGRKALSVNLSDIAAMLGVPRHATVSLHLPAELTFAFVDGLYDGLLERAAENVVHIVGGNGSRCNIGIVVEVTLLGQAKRVVRRAGALAGDLAVGPGTLGGAAEGLKLLAQGARLDEDGNLAGPGGGRDRPGGALTACPPAHLGPPPPPGVARGL